MSKQFVEYFANFIQTVDGWVALVIVDGEEVGMFAAKTLDKTHNKVDKAISKHAKQNDIFALRTIRRVSWLDGRVNS